MILQLTQVENQNAREKISGSDEITAQSFVFSEYFRGERLEIGALVPGVGWQSRFLTCLLQESNSVPAMFHGYLRQQQSLPVSEGNQQSVTANLHLFRFNRKQRGEHADVDLQGREILFAQCRKTRIVKGRGTRRLGNGPVEW